LERVRRSGGVFHVWFHPENLYAEWPRLENVVARFLEELGILVRDGDLRCLTMGQLASEFQTKSAIKQGGNLSPARAEHEYVERATPERELGTSLAISRQPTLREQARSAPAGVKAEGT
jgi:hypothetical protein